MRNVATGFGFGMLAFAIAGVIWEPFWLGCLACMIATFIAAQYA